MIRLLKIVLIVFIKLIYINSLFSQVSQEWTQRYGENGIDGGNSIAIDNLGSVYVTGSGGNQSNIITIKYSPSGNKQWVALYDGFIHGNDGASSISLDNNGNVIVAGQSQDSGSGYDYITIKYSASGNQKWVSRYTSIGNHSDAVYALIVDNSGNIYVTGESFDNIGGRDYLTIKYDSTGIQQWVARYNGANFDDKAYTIAVDDSNNVFVSGESRGETAMDIATIKYNSIGILQWAARYNGPLNGNDGAFKVLTDNNGNVFVCGYSVGEMHYDDYVILKYNSSGKEQWSRRYNGSGNYLDQARDLVIDKSGNIYVSGYAAESGSGYDFTTIKYNTYGDQQWIKKYNNGLNDYGDAMTIDDNQNIYVTGESDGNGTGYDYATVKYDSSGNRLWVMRYDYSGQFGDYPQAIAIDNNGSVLITGQSNRDYLTIKYSQLTGATINESNIPAEYELSQNYPNPFNPTTNLEFGVSKYGFVSLKVYDVLGNEVATLVNENKPSGNYVVEFDAHLAERGSGFPSGIYFYSLSVNGNIIDTKRMVLLK